MKLSFLPPLAVLALALTACGPEDTLEAYDVDLVTFSDCIQVGSGAVNCEDEAALQQVTLSGRWVLDRRGPDTFIVTTHTGRTIPGVFFENDGAVTSRSCIGGGGRCYFARSRLDTINPDDGCLQITERVIDVVVDEDAMTGEMSDVAVSDESCGTSVITEVRIGVSGRLSEEAVRSREQFPTEGQ